MSFDALPELGICYLSSCIDKKLSRGVPKLTDGHDRFHKPDPERLLNICLLPVHLCMT